MTEETMPVLKPAARRVPLGRAAPILAVAAIVTAGCGARSCGAVKDADCVAGHPICLDPVDDAGYLVGEADVTFWGLCPQCRPEAG